MSTERATFGAGCFWGVEHEFRRVPGVTDVVVGYAGGTTPNPSYHDVCTGRTGHAEVAQVVFDPSVVSFEQLLEVFWAMHDPTQVDQQGPDHGSQYRSVILAHSPEQRAAAEASKAQAGEPERPTDRDPDHRRGRFLPGRGLSPGVLRQDGPRAVLPCDPAGPAGRPGVGEPRRRLNGSVLEEADASIDPQPDELRPPRRRRRPRARRRSAPSPSRRTSRGGPRRPVPFPKARTRSGPRERARPPRTRAAPTRTSARGTGTDREPEREPCHREQRDDPGKIAPIETEERTRDQPVVGGRSLSPPEQEQRRYQQHRPDEPGGHPGRRRGTGRRRHRFASYAQMSRRTVCEVRESVACSERVARWATLRTHVR